MRDFLQEVSNAGKKLVRNPAFTTIALVSLVFGIGLNVLVFSLVNMLLLQPLEVESPQDLFRLYSTQESGFRYGASSYPDLEDFRRAGEGLVELFAERFTPLSLGSEGRAQLVWGQMVTGNYFPGLGIRPHLGRLLEARDNLDPDAHAVVVLSHQFWQKRFGGDTEAVGSSVVLNGRSYEVIGVAPKTFRGTLVGSKVDLWAPMMMQRQLMPVGDRLNQRGARWMTVTGRLAPGVSLDQARGSLVSVARQLGTDYPETNENRIVTLIPLEEDTVPFQAQGIASKASILLLLVCASVLLVACANLASVLLAQAANRRREVALRQALGASRWGLVRQIFFELLLLCLIAAGLAVALASMIGKLIRRLPLPSDLPVDLSLGTDWRVLLFAFGMALLVCAFLAFGPALRSTKVDLVDALKGGGQGAGRGRWPSLRSSLVVLQVALSVVLLTVAGFFLRSMQSTLSISPGFAAGNVMVGTMHLGLQGYDEGRARSFLRLLEERVEGLPEVEGAAFAELVPLVPGANQQISLGLSGPGPSTAENETIIDYNLVTPGYLAVMGIPLLQGRDFSSEEAQVQVHSVIVNREAAQRFWSGDAVGHQVNVGGSAGLIVGVVGDSKYRSLGEAPQPFLYLSFEQQFEPTMTLHVRTRGDAASMISPVLDEIRGLDENLPVESPRSLLEQVLASSLPVRLGANVLGAFGVFALLLAAIGTYGVSLNFVAQRRREMGVRLALGAEPGNLRSLVLRQGLTLAIIGVVVGLVVAFLAGGALASVLYGIRGGDPMVLTAVPVLLLLVAAVSTLIPAMKATRVNPVEVLRAE